MKKIIFVSIVAAMALTGCMSTKERISAEYNRIISIAPAQPVVCACDKSIESLGAAVCDIHNLSQEKLNAYVKATENHREYIGFMNDVELLVKEEGLNNEDAVKRVSDEILKEDATRADEEKVWPRVTAGIESVESLKPEVVLTEIAAATVKNIDFIQTANGLRDSFNGFDETTLEKLMAVKDITLQATETSECLGFLTEQYRKVLVAKLYKK